MVSYVKNYILIINKNKMANLTAKLQLSGSNLTSDALSISVSDVLTVTNPTVPMARLSIATGSGQTIIPSNSAFSYIYVKLISGTNSTDFLGISIGGATNVKMRVGEFLFMPIYNAKVVLGEAYGGACIVEYGYWSI
tara:strand:- start:696 stop:1106 length:411 start_codon:yes stop_codon:yes gene_type:complete